MNKWEEVARLFDLELEEEFEIEGYIGKYKFTNEGVLKKIIDVWLDSGLLICKLLEGEYKIKRSWKPTEDCDYWYWDTSLQKARMFVFEQEKNFDITNWKIGNCFKTEEEAEIEGREIMEQIRQEYEEILNE